MTFFFFALPAQPPNRIDVFLLRSSSSAPESHRRFPSSLLQLSPRIASTFSFFALPAQPAKRVDFFSVCVFSCECHPFWPNKNKPKKNNETDTEIATKPREKCIANVNRKIKQLTNDENALCQIQRLSIYPSHAAYARTATFAHYAYQYQTKMHLQRKPQLSRQRLVQSLPQLSSQDSPFSLCSLVTGKGSLLWRLPWSTPQ
jgi:hypothetical protein